VKTPMYQDHSDLVTRLRLDPIGLLKEAHRSGDSVVLALGRGSYPTIVSFAHPQIVREVLVRQHKAFHKGEGMYPLAAVLGQNLITLEEPPHKMRRRLIQPLFRREHITSYGKAMAARTLEQCSKWRDGEVIDIGPEMIHLTLAIVLETLLGVRVSASEVRSIAHAAAEAENAFNRFGLAFSDVLEPPSLVDLDLLRDASSAIDGALMPIIERYRQEENEDDLVSLLLRARDEEHIAGLTTADVRNEMIGFILAGHLTTATALTWAWYLLGRHPDALLQLENEADPLFDAHKRDGDELPNLPFSRAVLAESMRLFPPAWATHRRVVQEIQLDGLTLPVGALVILPQIVTHRDVRWFASPDAFDPHRWLSEEPKPPNGAYYPFGAGPRLCIGEPFTWIEGTLILATICHSWRLENVGGAVDLQAKTTLQPLGGMKMRAVTRNSIGS
jgi:cytochrome P450